MIDLSTVFFLTSTIGPVALIAAFGVGFLNSEPAFKHRTEVAKLKHDLAMKKLELDSLREKAMWETAAKK